MIKYFKCAECGSILETIECKDVECLNCEGQVFENIGKENETPQWVKGCSSCKKRSTCNKIKN